MRAEFLGDSISAGGINAVALGVVRVPERNFGFEVFAYIIVTNEIREVIEQENPLSADEVEW